MQQPPNYPNNQNWQPPNYPNSEGWQPQPNAQYQPSWQQQPPYYNQPTEAFQQPQPTNTYYPPQPPQPGQFQPPPLAQSRSTTETRFSQWLKRQSKIVQVGIGCGIILAVLMICSFAVIAAAASVSKPSTPTAAAPTDTPTQTTLLAAPTDTPMPTDTPVPSPTATPTSQPTVTPTPQPVAQATPTTAPIRPTPTPTHCVGVNNNPWCYDFNPGKLIYYPPTNFCAYFNCIPTFVGSDDPGDGYIIECQDGTYSQSGGESGACSYHGGEMRPLYSH